ncbi:hypothetical protein ES705_34729 [subsurface metagenome]
MVMIRNILISELCLVLIFILHRLLYFFKRDRALEERRRKRMIDSKQKLKPEMRDPILKRG